MRENRPPVSAHYLDCNEGHERACQTSEVQMERLHIHRQPERTTPQYLMGSPTMRWLEGACDTRDIEAGLKDLRTVIRGTPCVDTVPALGYGVRGLDKGIVKPMIAKAL